MELPTLKKCTKCGECKPSTPEFFRKQNKVKSGLDGRCKICDAAYYMENADAIKIRQAVNQKRDPKRGARYYSRHKNAILQRKKERYNAGYKVFCALQASTYRASNQARIVEYRRSYEKCRNKTDQVFALKNRIRSLIRQSIKAYGFSKTSKTCQMLGCSFEFFLEHIERQFLKGMSWENRDQWHIDHIIPLATAKNEEDVIRLNHYTNLRPLWAKDNLAKSDKVLYLI